MPTALRASSTSSPPPAAHLNTLRHLLHGLDRHCVPDVQTLERTPHAMTAQGLMSSQSGHFDKQDQKRLDQDWMTGLTTATGWRICYNKESSLRWNIKR